MPDGPGGFAQDSSCPALLRIPLRFAPLRVRSFHALRPTFPGRSARDAPCDGVVLLPRARRNARGLGCSPVARHYWGNHCCFLFLRVLRCFSSPRSAYHVLLRLREPRHPPCALALFFLSHAAGASPARGRAEPRCLACANMSKILRRKNRHVENNGFEPLTPCLQSRCSSQLS